MAHSASVDAPTLAAPGPFGVGVSSLTVVDPAQPDPLAWSSTRPELPRNDRPIALDVWYPAPPGAKGAPAVYPAALTGEDGHDVAFTLTGKAVRGASRAPGPFPLVILAHGYGGTPVAMNWLAEALASKGYVVVGPHFDDPPITQTSKFVGPLTRRPLDIAFVAAEAQRRARVHEGPFASADPDRTVLIGYSMGGYGALTAAGAPLSPALGALTHGALAPFVSGAPRAQDLKVAHVVAVVVISPAGLFSGGESWSDHGLSAITAPSLFIVGSQDQVVGYDPGVKTLFDQETSAPRYLLTFENAGHSIGMDAAPAAMRSRLWDLDWFEDPVWRKSRVLAIETHFITAFLDLEVKGERDKAAYLDVAEPISNHTAWPAKPGEAYDAISSGAAPATVWKGFQRSHIAGLELRFSPAATAK
jgi:predicted dienelactone hydrolase